MNYQLRFILTLAAAGFCASVYGSKDLSSEISELRAGLSEQDDAQRLQSLFLIYEYTYEQGDPEAELAALYPYLNEAARQGNVAEESYARIQRICFFYNNNMEDSLYRYYPSTMEFLRRNSKWAGYYFAALLNVKFSLFADRPAQALRDAQSLYEEARLQNNNYGIGASSYILGKIRFDADRYRDAIPYFRESVRLLEKEEDPTMLFSAYDELSEALCEEGLYDEALAVLQQWEKMLGKHNKDMAAGRTFHSVNNYEFYCDCGFANVYSRLRMFPEARAALLKAEEKCKGGDLYCNVLFQAKSVYCEEFGDHKAAVSWFEKSLSAENGVTRRGRYNSNIRYARLLVSAGRPADATAVYEEALAYAGQMLDREIAVKTEEMEHHMEIDRLNAQTRTRGIVALVVMASLLIVFCIYFFYSRRLRIKNRVLSDQLDEVSRLKTWRLSHMVSSLKDDPQKDGGAAAGEVVANGSEKNGHNKNEEMVWLACRKMIDEKKFCDPSLNRKQLADMLGTNENYLASAIREVNGGQTVGDFINDFRLDYARRLITERSNMTLDAIAHDSGLVTRSTLFRLFLKKFGMSPSHYRSEQLKNQKIR